MDPVDFYTNARVVVQTDKLTLSIEKLHDNGVAVNAGCNTYGIRFAIVEIARDTHSLLVVPTSGTEHAFLEPPEKLVLNLWDPSLNGSSYEDAGRSILKLEKFNERTRYIFHFEDDIEYARCMELFFITRRVMVERAREQTKRSREIEHLQDEVLATMIVPSA